MSNVTEEGKQWFALIPADELHSADLRVFGAGLWFVIYDCFCYEDQKKCCFIYVCHQRDLFQNSCKGQWRCWPFNNLRNVQITFPLMTLSWYYHIFDKKENQMTRCWIISEMYLLFWHCLSHMMPDSLQLFFLFNVSPVFQRTSLNWESPFMMSQSK